MTDRHFTEEEAQALVPWLRGACDAVELLKPVLALAQERVHSLVTRIRSNGDTLLPEELAGATQVLDETEEAINEHAAAIVEKGVLIRSLDLGHFDFPSLKDGREVHLCWLAGEDSITHWHELDAGFVGRQSL